MTYCSHCGSNNKTNNKYCSNCGALLEERTDVRCPICGSPNKLGSVYCDTCGGRLATHADVNLGRSDILAPLPQRPFPPATRIGEDLQIKKEINPEPAEASFESESPEPEKPARADLQSEDSGSLGPVSTSLQAPEWIARIQRPPPNPPVPSGQPAGELPRRLSWQEELPAADVAETVDDTAPQGGGDWLANLRAAAMIELEAARPQPERSRPEAEPLAVPKWFAYIRPPLDPRVSPRTVLEPERASTPANLEQKEGIPSSRIALDERETSQASGGEENKPQIGTGGLPDWLAQLKATSMESEPALTPLIEPGHSADSPQMDAKTFEGQQTTPQWVRDLRVRGPHKPPTQVQNGSSAVGRSSEDVTSSTLEANRQPQPRLTPEEEQGLPDWLTSPVEAGPLLAQLQGSGPQTREADSIEIVGRENSTPPSEEPAHSKRSPSPELSIPAAERPAGLVPSEEVVPAEGPASPVKTDSGQIGAAPKAALAEEEHKRGEETKLSSELKLELPSTGLVETTMPRNRATGLIPEMRGRLKVLFARFFTPPDATVPVGQARGEKARAARPPAAGEDFGDASTGLNIPAPRVTAGTSDAPERNTPLDAEGVGLEQVDSAPTPQGLTGSTSSEASPKGEPDDA